MLKSRWSVVWWGVVPLPCLVAYLIDASFSSPAHIPIVGISGICVALCDALFGQIVAACYIKTQQYSNNECGCFVHIFKYRFFHVTTSRSTAPSVINEIISYK